MIKALGREIIDLVFPVYCLSCGKENVYFCAGCAAKIPKLEKQICIICQKPSAFGKTHAICQTKYHPDGMLSALSYKDTLVKKIIGAFKYELVIQLAPSLSELVFRQIASQGLTDYFNNFTLVPVPLHKKRLNWRGFNQAEVLAGFLAEKLNIPINNDLAQRTKSTKLQAELKLEQRQKNIEGAFQIIGKANGNFLLIDDVVTSGTTALELTRLMKKAGASQVWVLALAHG